MRIAAASYPEGVLAGLAYETWKPRRRVVLHASKRSYLDAAGRGARSASGSSLVDHMDGRIVSRRIDLVVDNRQRTTALPHELTQVVLADEFDFRQPPP